MAGRRCGPAIRVVYSGPGVGGSGSAQMALGGFTTEEMGLVGFSLESSDTSDGGSTAGAGLPLTGLGSGADCAGSQGCPVNSDLILRLVNWRWAGTDLDR